MGHLLNIEIYRVMISAYFGKIYVKKWGDLYISSFYCLALVSNATKYLILYFFIKY